MAGLDRDLWDFHTLEDPLLLFRDLLSLGGAKTEVIVSTQ